MTQKILIRIEGYQDGKNVTGTTRTITLDGDRPGGIKAQVAEIEDILCKDHVLVQLALAVRRGENGI